MRPRSPIGGAVRIALVDRPGGPQRSRTRAPVTESHRRFPGRSNRTHSLIKSIEVNAMSNESQCPFSADTVSGRSNRDWWPNQLNLDALHTNHPAGNPMGESFNYAQEFKSLDLAAVKKD